MSTEERSQRHKFAKTGGVGVIPTATEGGAKVPAGPNGSQGPPSAASSSEVPPLWWWIVPKYVLARMADGNESRTLSVSLELKRIARTQAYARVHGAFWRDRKRCAELVLDGKWEQVAATLELEEQEAFLRSLFEASSEHDDRPVPNVLKNWPIVDPVSVEEVANAFHDSVDSAPGPDALILISELSRPLCSRLHLTCGS